MGYKCRNKCPFLLFGPSPRFEDGGKLILVIISLIGFFTFDMVYVAAVMNYAAQSEMLVYLLKSVRGLVEQKGYEDVDSAIKVVGSNAVFWHFYFNTVEPLIMDTLKNGQPPYNDTLFAPCLYNIVHTYLPPKKGQPLNNGQMLVPNVSIIWRFHCIREKMSLLHVAVSGKVGRK